MNIALNETTTGNSILLKLEINCRGFLVIAKGVMVLSGIYPEKRNPLCGLGQSRPEKPSEYQIR